MVLLGWLDHPVLALDMLHLLPLFEHHVVGLGKHIDLIVLHMEHADIRAFRVFLVLLLAPLQELSLHPPHLVLVLVDLE